MVDTSRSPPRFMLLGAPHVSGIPGCNATRLLIRGAFSGDSKTLTWPKNRGPCRGWNAHPESQKWIAPVVVFRKVWTADLEATVWSLGVIGIGDTRGRDDKVQRLRVGACCQVAFNQVLVGVWRRRRTNAVVVSLRAQSRTRLSRLNTFSGR